MLFAGQPGILVAEVEPGGPADQPARKAAM
jgi:hypothetical protein